MDVIEVFKKQNPNKELILLYKAGSHFFDLNNENSDTDYRGIYIDCHQDSFSSNPDKIYQIEIKTNPSGSKVANTKDDIDLNIFSLSSALKLIGNGDFNLIEAMYTPEDKIIYQTELYREIRSIRDDLIHTDISAFIGFIKREANRYGVNIFHYDLQKNFIEEVLDKHHPYKRLSEIWPEVISFCERNPIARITTSTATSGGVRIPVPSITIANRLHQSTASIGYVKEAISNIIANYGNRQRKMAETGRECKGLMHSLRLIYEANDILDFGSLILPFDEKRMKILRSIKSGDVDQDYVFNLIDEGVINLQYKSLAVKNNKKQVQYRIDKILFTLRGRNEIFNAIKRAKNLHKTQ